MTKLRGNCYVATEALYHILGGSESYWQPMRMRIGRETHWFLRHKAWETILDPSRLQFEHELNYTKGIRTAFLTRKPSKRAMKLMMELTWQQPKATR